MADRRVPLAGAALLDRSLPLAARFRALFVLKNVGGDEAARCIEKCFHGEDSALLKHELAYCLGQMRASVAADTLMHVLSQSTTEHAMVRHECAEALGAVGHAPAGPLLRRHTDASVEPAVEVRQTCELALRRIEWLAGGGGEAEPSGQCHFRTIDPSPAADDRWAGADADEVSQALCDPTQPIWDRYTAMFALRNRNTEAAAVALARGLDCGDSALLRHEVAYVLGQMRSAATVGPLARCLRRREEASMVRHECAEALGSIATEECTEILRGYVGEGDRIVRESAQVALDMAEYESSDAFQIDAVK